MKCENPYSPKQGLAVGCGRCLPCLFNRRRIWSHRLILESNLHSDNAFVTLTYSDEHLPIQLDTGLATLAPKHLQLWLKRLRKAWGHDKPLRFFACGEYGEQTFRPHYHVALFGYPHCRYGLSRYSARKQNCCDVCDLIRDTWGRGNIFSGLLEANSAQYIAGYVTKKMTHRDDSRLLGREPEFARMSNRPGIGASFMHEVASGLMQFNLDTTQGDVPVTLRHGSRELPLGRYLRKKLREYIGHDPETPPEVIQALAEKMSPLLAAARTSKEAPSLKEQILKQYAGERAAFHARSKLFNKRKVTL